MAPASRWNTASRSARSLRLGELTVTAIPDGSVQLDPLLWFPDSTTADWKDEHAGLVDGHGFLAGSVGSLLVEHDGRALLIDTGFGPQRISASDTIEPIGVLEGGGLPASLEQAGCDPAAIEAVAFTHLHDDHIGWAFRAASGSDGSGGSGGGHHLFRSATFLASAAEWAEWTMPPELTVPTRAVVTGQEIFPGVTAWVTPGHTPGHTVYVIESGGRRLVAFGDVFHTPAQVTRPDWRAALDVVPDQAIASRHALLGELLRPGTLAFANHFADVQFGQVVRDPGSGRRRWRPIEGTERMTPRHDDEDRV